MAAKGKGGDSKQGLIITLVVFVLLTIGLGVMTYIGFADKESLQKAKNDAGEKEKVALRARDWEKFKGLLFKAAAGLAANADLEPLGALRDEYQAGKLGDKENDKKEIDDIVKRLDTELGWDANLKKPKSNYIAQLEDVRGQFAAKEKELGQVKANNEKLIKQYKDEVTEANKAKALAQQESSDAQKKVADAQAAFSRKLAEALDNLPKVQDENERLQKEMQLKTEKSVAETGDLTKALDELKTTNRKLRDKTQPVNLISADKPKGKISSIRSNGLVFINLGSADNVKPPLTFSVFGIGPNGKALAERKAALEVVSVLNPHQSLARVTDWHDRNRDPVITGDLLFNPVWDPNQRQHVAIAGLIDLTGDGTDSGAVFRRMLENQGIVIDAYLDLRDLEIKGKITHQTDFFIKGQTPDEQSGGPPLAVGNSRLDRVPEIRNKIGELEGKAISMGSTVLTARRFLTLIGAQLPKNVSTADFGIHSPTSSGKSDPSTPAREPAEKDEAKEKGDKDESKEKEPATKEEMKEKEAAPKEKPAAKEKAKPPAKGDKAKPADDKEMDEKPAKASDKAKPDKKPVKAEPKKPAKDEADKDADKPKDK